jgi:hypothetical protein
MMKNPIYTVTAATESRRCPKQKRRRDTMNRLRKRLATALTAVTMIVVLVSPAAAAPAYPLNNIKLPDKATYICNDQSVILDNVSAHVINIQQTAINIVIDISPVVAPTVNPIIAPNININLPNVIGKK